MKSRFSLIFAIGLAFFAFIPTKNVCAQTFTKSDTIVFHYPYRLEHQGLNDFDTLNVGDTECHTIFVKNGENDPVIVKLVSTSNSGSSFTVKTIPTLPVVLLKDEVISIVDLCFSPKPPIVDSVAGTYLSITFRYSGYDSSGSYPARGFQTADTNLKKPCVTVVSDAKLTYGPIIIDGTVSHSVTIKSNRYDTLYVGLDNEFKSPDNYAFSTPGITFPYALAPLGTITFPITFSPRSTDSLVKYRFVGNMGWIVYTVPIDPDTNYHSGACSHFNYDLIGVAVPPTADSISTSLNAGSTDVLAMISAQYATTQTFHFKNTGTTNLKVTGVSLKNGKSFAITDIKPTTTLPFTLAPGESMSVDLTLTSTANGVYYDEVIITAEAGIISMNFQLQGLRKNGTVQKVNNTKNAEEHIALYPNPSTGRIMLALPDKHTTNIKVYNMLGTVIAATSATSSWTWESHLPAGTYLLEAEGITDEEKPFTDTRRFVIEK